MVVHSSERELVHELGLLGVQVTSVWELGSLDDHPQAEPLLLDWLKHLEDRVPTGDRRGLREGLVRSLRTAHNKDLVLPVLFELMWRINEDDEPLVRWAIGDTIGHLARKKDLPELRRICASPLPVISRQVVIEALGRLRDTASGPLLVELLRDPPLTGHAAHALVNAGDGSALPALKAVASDSTRFAWVRREAARAIRMIEKRSNLTGGRPDGTAGIA